MRALAASLALIALAGCVVTGAPPPVVPVGPQTVLAVQPAEVPAFSNVNPPSGTVGATLWGPVEKLPAPPTAVSSSAGILDIVIDSASIPGNVKARAGLGTIVLGWSPVAWVKAAGFRASYDLRVTRADHSSGAVAQVVAYLNLRDVANKASLWLGQIFFDTRCDKGGDVGWDAGTNTPMFNVVAPNFSCRTFGDWRSVSFAVGPAQIAAAASALRARYPALRLSSDLGDYELTHGNVNPEVAVKPGESARIDAGIKGWRITTQP